MPDSWVEDQLRSRDRRNEFARACGFDEHVVLAVENQGRNVDPAQHRDACRGLRADVDVHEYGAMPGRTLKLGPAGDQRGGDQGLVIYVGFQAFGDQRAIVDAAQERAPNRVLQDPECERNSGRGLFWGPPGGIYEDQGIDAVRMTNGELPC